MKKFLSSLLAGLILFQSNVSAVPCAFNGNDNNSAIRVLKLENNNTVIYVSHDKIQEFLETLRDYIDASYTVRNVLTDPKTMAASAGVGLLSLVALGAGPALAFKNNAEKNPNIGPIATKIGTAGVAISSLCFSTPLGVAIAAIPAYCNSKFRKHTPGSHKITYFWHDAVNNIKSTNTFDDIDLIRILRIDADAPLQDRDEPVTDLGAGIIIHMRGCDDINVYRCTTPEEINDSFPDLAQEGQVQERSHVLSVFESEFIGNRRLHFKCCSIFSEREKFHRTLQIEKDFTANDANFELMNKIFW